MKRQKVGRKLLEWDESDILKTEIEYKADEHWEDYVEDEEMKTWSKEKRVEYLWMKMSNMDISFYWDSLLEELKEVLDKKNKGKYWAAQVQNFGWRSLNGKKVFESEDSKEFLRKLLPDCDCTFKIFNYGRGLAIQNAHHDSPVSAEFYYVMPIGERAYNKMTR